MRRLPLLAMLVFLAARALAHGEHLVIMPFSFLPLLAVALVFLAVPWYTFWYRALVAVVLLIANVLLWAPVSRIAYSHTTAAFLILLAVPVVVAGAAAAVLQIRRTDDPA